MLNICTIWQNNFPIVRLNFLFFVSFFYSSSLINYLLFFPCLSFLKFFFTLFYITLNKESFTYFFFWTDHNWYPWPSIDFRGKCLFVLSFIIIAVIAFVCVFTESKKIFVFLVWWEVFVYLSSTRYWISPTVLYTPTDLFRWTQDSFPLFCVTNAKSGEIWKYVQPKSQNIYVYIQLSTKIFWEKMLLNVTYALFIDQVLVAMF